MNLILFGGSFDPIHNAHINIAKECAKLYRASVVFIPNKNSPWKEKTTEEDDKYNMVKLAIDGIKEFSVSRYELEQEGINYTINTIKYFKSKYKSDNLYLLIGTDQANLFDKWKEADEIIKYVKIICYTRPNYVLDMDMVKRFDMDIVKADEYDISSSDIRELKSANAPISILKYIQDNSLFYMNKIKKYIGGERLFHSMSVALLSYEIALANNIENQDKAYIGGILHDIGKNITNEAIERINKEYSFYLPIAPKLYHQFYSKIVTLEDFNINDGEILSAISYHATGKANMSVLDKIIYVSDKLDPLRGYDSSKMIEECKKDINKGFIEVLKQNKDYLVKSGKSIENKLSVECFNYYLH